MKKALAKGLAVIIEAGIYALAEKMKKRRKKNGNSGGLDRFRDGCGAYGVRHRSAAHSSVMDIPRRVIRPHVNERSISWE